MAPSQTLERTVTVSPLERKEPGSSYPVPGPVRVEMRFSVSTALTEPADELTALPQLEQKFAPGWTYCPQEGQKVPLSPRAGHTHIMMRITAADRATAFFIPNITPQYGH